MISLTDPIDFKAAIDHLRDKDILPTALSSADLQAQANAGLLQKSFFSARITDAALLQELKDSVDKILSGKSNYAAQRGELKSVVAKYGASELLTSARLQLILKTNTQLSRGYGQWQEANDPTVLLVFPAQELIRQSYRKAPRIWREIWNQTRMGLLNATATDSSSGRLVAMKNDPIWTAISDFGLPYPPFRYNSGMNVRDVDKDEAIELGVMTPDVVPKVPKKMPMNKGLSSSAASLDSGFIKVLLQSLVGFSLVGTELMLSGDDNDSISNRSVNDVMEELLA